MLVFVQCRQRWSHISGHARWVDDLGKHYRVENALQFRRAVAVRPSYELLSTERRFGRNVSFVHYP